MPQAAAVIDLETFRRRREARPEPVKCRAGPAAPVSPYLVPVWIAWVPVWLVH
jgi:hypothetical protein